MRLLRYVLVNGAFVVCLYYGLVVGVTGAYNIAMFVGWLTVVLSLGMFADSTAKDYITRKHPVPVWVDHSYDAFIIVFMVWNGIFVLSAGYVLHVIAFEYMRRRSIELTPPKEVEA